MKNVLKTAMKAASIGAALGLIMPAFADVPVLDQTTLQEKNKQQDFKDKIKKEVTDTNNSEKGVNCSISQKEKYRRLHRTSSQIAQEEGNNIAMVRAAAQKYHVPEGLALAVAQAESGVSTCSGSPTGVKGVMQLTKKTGKGLGFDRDVNEQNIEGGVKYLSQGLKYCGNDSYDYKCLAAWYNGSTSAQQAGWASNAASARGFWNTFTGENNLAPGAANLLSANTYINYGDSTPGGAYGMGSVNNAMAYLSGNGVANRDQTVAALVGGIGQDQDLLEAMMRNSSLRNSNIGALNEAIQSMKTFTDLANSLNLLALQNTSSTAAVATTNPNGASIFSCDPVLLQTLGIPEASWQQCARIKYSPGDGRVIFVTVDGAETVVATIQNKSLLNASLKE